MFGSSSAAAGSQGGGLFGSTASTASSAFGAPAPPQQGGLFGSSAPAQGSQGGGFGGFGSSASAPAPAFGASVTGFGNAPAPAQQQQQQQQQQQGGLFGSSAPAQQQQSGLFGSPAPAQQQQQQGGLFGSNPASAMGASTGQAQGQGQGRGTMVAPYQASRKADGTTPISFQSITAMAQYEHKSFEELRVEDYMAGNKGSQGQQQSQPAAGGAFGAAPVGGGGAFGAPAAATGTFGSPTPAPGGFGGFGASPVPASSAGGGGLFGSSSTPAPSFGAAPAAYGAAPAGGGGMFGGGAPAAAPGGMFGGAAPAPAAGGMFGGAPAGAASGGLFGSTPAAAQGGLFGSNPVAAPSGGMFGSTPAAAPGGGLFGNTSAPAAGGGLFGGTPAAAGGGLFGSTSAPVAGGGLFGSPPAAAPGGGLFGSTPAAPAGGGMFGSTAAAPSGGLFGSTPAAAPGGGLFGSNPAAAPQGGGLFGGAQAPAPTSGFFGSAPAPSPAGGLFGSTPSAAPAGGMFGGAPAAPAPVAPGGTTILVPPASETLLAQQMAAIENQNNELAVLEAWRGGNGKSRTDKRIGGITPTSVFQRDAQAVRYRGLTGSISTSNTMNMNGSSSSVLNSYQAAPRSAAKIRPRGFGPTKTTIGNGSRSAMGMLSPTSFLGSATKQLVIKPHALTPKPKTRLLLSDESMAEKKKGHEERNGVTGDTPRDLIKGRNITNDEAETPGRKTDRGLPFENSRITNDKAGFVSPDAGAQEKVAPASKVTPPPESSRARKGADSPVDQSYDFYRAVIGSPAGRHNGNNVEYDVDTVNHLIPNLTKDGYVMTPAAEAMREMSEADLAAVPNFIVERVGYGSVAWDGTVDVRGIDLDSVICIEQKAVDVYYEQEANGSKPAIGTKLNRSAILTLHDVFPKNGPDSSDSEKEKFERKIAKKTKEMGASLVLYDSDIGVWKMHVEHFSRYALDDDSDDEEDEVEIIDAASVQIEGKKSDFKSGVRGGRTQVSWATVGGLTRFRVPDNEDDDMGEESNALLAFNDSGGNAIQAAEAAYNELSQIDDQMLVDGPEMEEHKTMFAEEAECCSEYIEDDVFPPPSGPIPTMSICAQIAKKCNVNRPTSSATDFGMRMGRSFAVCWRPDGSFLHPAVDDRPETGNKRLMQSRPVIDATSSSSKETFLLVHKKHSINMNELGDFPIFKLVNKDDSLMEDYDKIAKLMVQNVEISDQSLCCLASHAFNLISILFGDVKDDDPFMGTKRRDHSFELWLRNVCAVDVEAEIQVESANQNYHNAIFAALSGGNFAKAAALARRSGHCMLALLISNSSSMHGASLSEQMKLWNDSGAIKHFSPELVRIYSLLTNDLQLENELYLKGNQIRWERRMMMLLKVLNHNYGGSTSTVSMLVDQYELDVESGIAPPPFSRTMEANEETSFGHQPSILFRVMKAFKCVESDSSKVPIISIISPSGHTSNPADVSTSFHFAALLSCLHVGEELSEDEESALIGSYSSQLQNAGSWEWAVYISLCQFRESSTKWEMRKDLAQEIICRYYVSSQDDDLQARRAFLENELGLPSSWFAHSLAISAVQNFDVQSFITNSISICRKDSLRVYEEAILPDVLFNGSKEDYRDIHKFLSELGDDNGDGTTLREVVFDYLELRKEVISFAKHRVDSPTLETDFKILSRRTLSIQKRLQILMQGKSNCPKLFQGSPMVPNSVLLTELMSSIYALVTALQDTMEGTIADQGYDKGMILALGNASQLAFSCSNDDFVFSQIDSKAVLRGKYRMIDLKLPMNSGPVYRPQRL